MRRRGRQHAAAFRFIRLNLLAWFISYGIVFFSHNKTASTSLSTAETSAACSDKKMVGPLRYVLRDVDKARSSEKYDSVDWWRLDVHDLGFEPKLIRTPATVTPLLHWL